MVLLIAVVLKLDFFAPEILTHSEKTKLDHMGMLTGYVHAMAKIDSGEKFWYVGKGLPSSAGEKEYYNRYALREEGTLPRNLNNTCQKYSLLHVRLIRRRSGHCSWKPVFADERDSFSNQQQKVSPASRHHSIKSLDGVCRCCCWIRGRSLLRIVPTTRPRLDSRYRDTQTAQAQSDDCNCVF